MKKGFSLAEIVVIIAILGIIMAIGVINFGPVRKNKILETTTDGIVFTLEKAKAEAVSGKGGVNAGVKFNTGSYIYFSGNSYSGINPNNITHTIDSLFTITETIVNSDNVIIFSRLTGVSNTTATVTVSQISNSSKKREVVIGALGSISVVK